MRCSTWHPLDACLVVHPTRGTAGLARELRCDQSRNRDPAWPRSGPTTRSHQKAVSPATATFTTITMTALMGSASSPNTKCGERAVVPSVTSVRAEARCRCRPTDPIATSRRDRRRAEKRRRYERQRRVIERKEVPRKPDPHHRQAATPKTMLTNAAGYATSSRWLTTGARHGPAYTGHRRPRGRH